jgi:HlyD family secretion protein
MALSAPRARPWNPGGVPGRLLLLGLAGAVALGGTYVALAGNPFTRNQQATTYQTEPVSTGTVQVTVAATGPITNPASVPLSFKSSGKLTEVDVAVGQTVNPGQTLAKLDTSDLELALDQAQAALTQQQANLATVSAGATPQ